jgi:conjugative transfer region protein TrbK
MKPARLLACLFLVVMGLNAARVVAQQSNSTSSGPPPVTDPLAKELERCMALHEQAANDPKCLAVSKEATRRFFQPPEEYKPGKVEMFPKEHNQPWTTDKQPASSPPEK